MYVYLGLMGGLLRTGVLFAPSTSTGDGVLLINDFGRCSAEDSMWTDGGCVMGGRRGEGELVVGSTSDEVPTLRANQGLH